MNGYWLCMMMLDLPIPSEYSSKQLKCGRESNEDAPLAPKGEHKSLFRKCVKN